MKVILKVIEGDTKGENFVLEEQKKYTFGRKNVDFVINPNDKRISKKHFTIEIINNKCLIKDVGSTNKTKVDNGEGELITLTEKEPPMELEKQDIIKAGYSTIEVSEILIDNDEDDKTIAIDDEDDYGEDEYYHYDETEDNFNDIDSYGESEDIGIGASIKDFKLEKQIGEGGMGKVYLAKNHNLGKEVAIKIVTDLGLSQMKDMKLFQRECRLMKEMKHINIISFFDFGKVSGNMYIMMEYADMGNLEQYMKSKAGKLPAKASAQIIRQVLNGLAYIHGRKIVHRDIKPQNILFKKAKAKQIIIKLSDFGLAKHFETPDENSITMEEGEVRGTFNYMPYEQFENPKHVRETCDIFSVGAMFYEMLTGKTIYNAKDASELLNNMYDHKITPIEKLLPSLNKTLIQVINRALMKNPGDRWKTSVEMAKFLDKYLSQS